MKRKHVAIVLSAVLVGCASTSIAEPLKPETRHATGALRGAVGGALVPVFVLGMVFGAPGAHIGLRLAPAGALIGAAAGAALPGGVSARSRVMSSGMGGNWTEGRGAGDSTRASRLPPCGYGTDEWQC
jgi:hypothetical protein